MVPRRSSTSHQNPYTDECPSIPEKGNRHDGHIANRRFLVVAYGRFSAGPHRSAGYANHLGTTRDGRAKPSARLLLRL